MEQTSLSGTLPPIDITPNQKASDPKDRCSSIHRHVQKTSTVHIFVTQSAGQRNKEKLFLTQSSFDFISFSDSGDASPLCYQ
jgi:hypothetical protein